MLQFLKGLLSNDLFNTFLSTFLGFISALLVEKIINDNNDKSVSKRLVKQLEIELREVHDIAKLNFSKKNNEFFLHPYSTTVWRGACSSNTVIYLNHYPFYSELIAAFEQIEDANDFEKECFFTYFKKRDNIEAWNTAKKLLINNRLEIVTITSKIINMISERED